MTEFTIQNKTFNVSNVLKLKSDRGVDALAAAKRDGADNIFFTVGNDFYVATGTGLDLKEIITGIPFSFRGKEARVTSVDDQINRASDGFYHLQWFLLGGTAIAFLA